MLHSLSCLLRNQWFCSLPNFSACADSSYQALFSPPAHKRKKGVVSRLWVHTPRSLHSKLGYGHHFHKADLVVQGLTTSQLALQTIPCPGSQRSERHQAGKQLARVKKLDCTVLRRQDLWSTSTSSSSIAKFDTIIASLRLEN